jgi:cyclophilin family peptidyl-prolyl cis-trans isomerase
LALLAIGLAAGCGPKSDANSEPAAASITGNSAGQPEKPAGAATPAKDGKGAASQKDARHPVVVLDTTVGAITINLDKENSPLTVDNFLTYVNSGHYDNTIFHQVLKDYVVMGGAYLATLQEKPTHPPVRNEAHNRQKNVRGAVTMVRRPDVTDSSTCQFFINVTDNPNLDYEDATPEKYGYCVFGYVAPESMSIVDKIAAVPVTDKPNFERIPMETVLIKSAKRVR